MMIDFWINSDTIKNSVYIPKYYNPKIKAVLDELRNNHSLFSIRELCQKDVIELNTGDEIGKEAYGTGDIPFVRTSDISNWEITSTPKQGVSKEIYSAYESKQDVKVGDILFVRDGTYLIGQNCLISPLDTEILYQSHIVKIRVKNKEILTPEILFLILNSPIVQNQIRSFQFTADIIDTIGNRIYEIILPIPKNSEKVNEFLNETKSSLKRRVLGKAFIRQIPFILESVLLSNSTSFLKDFNKISEEELSSLIKSRTITDEFGDFDSFWIRSDNIRNSIFLPKYYDPSIVDELSLLSNNCRIVNLKTLKREKKITYQTGDEIGKMAYGSGDIPFIRTSDFSNWEIKYNPKQGISQEVYNAYSAKQNTRANDILLVRDGTYLVGSSCIITENDVNSLYCAGLYKFHVNENDEINPYLLLGLLNSFIVKRQMRSKQFTRDVIDTLGNRIDEVYIPIPKDFKTRQIISESIFEVISSRINSRDEILKLSESIISN